MAKRRLNPRLVKIHRSYTVEEVATLLGLHRNTVRQWVKNGLPTCDLKRPMLILGRELAAFLQARRAHKRRTCALGQLYCLRCREPRDPAGRMADYQPLTATLGNLIAICSICDLLMYRRVSLTKIHSFRSILDITMPQAPSHIGESPSPSVNSDFNLEAASNDDAQRK